MSKKQPIGTKLFDYLPLITAITAVIFCYYLYRRLETSDTSETLDRFMINQRKFNKETSESLLQINNFLTQATQQNSPQEQLNDNALQKDKSPMEEIPTEKPIVEKPIVEESSVEIITKKN